MLSDLRFGMCIWWGHFGAGGDNISGPSQSLSVLSLYKTFHFIQKVRRWERAPLTQSKGESLPRSLRRIDSISHPSIG